MGIRGELELSKCGYHLIHYDFEDSGISKMRHFKNDWITLTNDKGAEVEIKLKSIYKPQKNLGHQKAPAGNCSKQFKEVKEKAVKLSNGIVKYGCSQSDTRMLYQLVWKLSIKYTLSQSFLAWKQLDKILKKSLPKIYSKCGYNQKTKKEILTGLMELSGVGFIPLEATAGTSYVMHLHKNWRLTEEESSNMIQILYAWNVLSAGVSFPLLEKPKIKLPYVKGSIFSAICAFLADIGGKIYLDNTMIHLALRENNMCLMGMTRELDLTDNQLKRLNCVCLWYNVTYLSKICDKEGKNIRLGIEDGIHDPKKYVRCNKGPQKKKPNRYSWKLWNRLLKTFMTTKVV